MALDKGRSSRLTLIVATPCPGSCPLGISILDRMVGAFELLTVGETSGDVGIGSEASSRRQAF